MYWNSNPKPEKTPKKPYKGLKRTALKKKFNKPTGEKDLFLEIWNERPHVSEINGDPLGETPHVYFFMHVVGKKAYPNFRLKKKNIKLATFDQHYYYDNGGPCPDPNPKDWDKIHELADELKIEYYKPKPTV